MTRGSPLALSAASGSLATLALQLFSDWSGLGHNPISTSLDSLSCDCPVYPFWSGLDIYSINWFWLTVGILLGFVLWPILEILVLLRQILISTLRRQVLAAARSGPLYRVW